MTLLVGFLVFCARGVGHGVVFACPRLWPVWFVMWGFCPRFGACLVVLGSYSWVVELGLVVCVVYARDVGFWFYLVVLFGVMLVWVVGCIGFVYDVLSGGFVSGCCPLPVF